MKTLHWSHAKRFCNEPITKRSPSSRPLLSIVHSSGFLLSVSLPCLSSFLLLFILSYFLFFFFSSFLFISSQTAELRVLLSFLKDPRSLFLCRLPFSYPLPVRGCDALIIIPLLPLRSFELPEYFPSTYPLFWTIVVFRVRNSLRRFFTSPSRPFYRIYHSSF